MVALAAARVDLTAAMATALRRPHATRGSGGRGTLLREYPRLAVIKLANLMSAFWRLARRQTYSVSIRFLIARMYFGRLARRPKALNKFARPRPVAAAAALRRGGRWRRAVQVLDEARVR